MKKLDILSIRREFNEKNIVLCFNGPISSALIQELGNALRNYLEAEGAEASRSMDVFGVYIELTQNIRHYTQARQYPDSMSSATVVIGHDGDHYHVVAGNIVEPADGRALQQKVSELSELDKAALKAAYKQQLRQPRDDDAVSGAGLGLIDVARKVRAPLVCELEDANDGKAFFTISAVI